MTEGLANSTERSTLNRKNNSVSNVSTEVIPVNSFIDVSESPAGTTFSVITHEQLQLASQLKGSILCVGGRNFICDNKEDNEQCIKKNKHRHKDNNEESDANIDQKENDFGSGATLSEEWIESAQQTVLPVRCSNTNAEFHKNKFGSGGRGRCIKADDRWYTPSEFEALCGRAASKDWKRSIRFGGRGLLALIECGILIPHATSCTCSSCCDDDSATGPIRLFTPYKRRRRHFEIESALNRKKIRKRSVQDESSSPESDTEKEVEKMTITDWQQNRKVETEWHGETSYVKVKANLLEDLVVGIQGNKENVIETTVTPNNCYISSPEGNKSPEVTHIRKLESLSDGFLKLSHKCQEVVEELRLMWSSQESLQQKEHVIVNPPMDPIGAFDTREEIVHMVDTVGLEPTADHSDNKKCANCDRDAFAECSMCRKTPYCSTFCQRKDWNVHQVECIGEQPGRIMLIVESSDHEAQIIPQKT